MVNGQGPGEQQKKLQEFVTRERGDVRGNAALKIRKQTTMNQLSKRESGTEVAVSGANAFEQYADAVNTRTIIGKILKFTKGEYTAGQNDDNIAIGTKMVANMDELMVGWVRWWDGKPTDHRMGRVADGFQAPRRSELGDTDDTAWETDGNGKRRDCWALSNYLIMMDTTGELYTFTTSSRGGLNAVGELCKNYGKMMRQKPAEFPVVEIRVDSYRHSNKEYGKIYTPVFWIVSWTPKTAIEKALASEATREAEQAAEDQKELGDDEPFTPPKTTKAATSRAGKANAPADVARF